MKTFVIGDKVRSKIHNSIGIVCGYDDILDLFIIEVNHKTYMVKGCYLEKIDDEALTRQCLFENADAFDTPFVPLKEKGKQKFTLSGLNRYYQAVEDDIKEREEKKMKEIKNQKVVDLYFSRKKEVLADEFDTTGEAIQEIDNNYIFIKQLKDQFKEYIEKNEIKDVNINNFPTLHLTEESKAKCDEAYNDYNNKLGELNNLKEEILALLSGCETYEQEITILKSYKIVTDDNKLV